MKTPVTGCPSSKVDTKSCACGFETTTPSIGRDNFTRAVIEELKFRAKSPDVFSTADLYRDIVTRLKELDSKPRHENDLGPSTPVHFLIGKDWHLPNIPLRARLRRQGLPVPIFNT